MESLIHKYAGKLIHAKLAGKAGDDQPLIGGLDDTLVWNRPADEIFVLEGVFSRMSINSIVFLKPVEPYQSLVRYLAARALEQKEPILPKDCETRTFLHDLPVISAFDTAHIARTLENRKSVIIFPEKDQSGLPGGTAAIAAHGTVSPEQGFVTVSSVCFACFIKFFTDYLEDLQAGTVEPEAHRLFDRIRPMVAPEYAAPPELAASPFSTEAQVYEAVSEAGRKTVEYGLVDSYFGNVSYLWNNVLYISQTGSSLDELERCIDPVPLDGSTSAGLTASSELSAHLETIARTGCRAILHGHPRFCVILSMDCDPKEKASCEFREVCHIKCPKKRFVEDTPIVPGEVGTGPTGLCNTLPAALEGSDGAIVYGHGLFTVSRTDFSHAFSTLLHVETRCFEIYMEKISSLRKNINPGNDQWPS